VANVKGTRTESHGSPLRMYLRLDNRHPDAINIQPCHDKTEQRHKQCKRRQPNRPEHLQHANNNRENAKPHPSLTGKYKSQPSSYRNKESPRLKSKRGDRIAQRLQCFSSSPTVAPANTRAGRIMCRVTRRKISAIVAATNRRTASPPRKKSKLAHPCALWTS